MKRVHQDIAAHVAYELAGKHESQAELPAFGRQPVQRIKRRVLLDGRTQLRLINQQVEGNGLRGRLKLPLTKDQFEDGVGGQVLERRRQLAEIEAYRSSPGRSSESSASERDLRLAEDLKIEGHGELGRASPQIRVSFGSALIRRSISSSRCPKCGAGRLQVVRSA